MYIKINSYKLKTSRYSNDDDCIEEHLNVFFTFIKLELYNYAYFACRILR